MGGYEYTNDVVLDGNPQVEDVGKPCAYCGQPCEGYHSTHRDGFCIGPEVPLCIACMSDDLLTLDDVWNKISHDEARRIQTEAAKIEWEGKRLSVGEIDFAEVTEAQLVEVFGCDACGVKEFQVYSDDLNVRLVGGDHPGTWRLTGAHVCATCADRSILTTASELLANIEAGAPVKTRVYRLDQMVYGGIEEWLRRLTKATAVTSTDTGATIKRTLVPGLMERLATGRRLFRSLEREPE